MYVCVCIGVTEDHVRSAGRAGITTADELIAALGLDEPICCGRCTLNIQEIVALADSAARASARAPVPHELTAKPVR